MTIGLWKKWKEYRRRKNEEEMIKKVVAFEFFNAAIAHGQVNDLEKLSKDAKVYAEMYVRHVHHGFHRGS